MPSPSSQEHDWPVVAYSPRSAHCYHLSSSLTIPDEHANGSASSVTPPRGMSTKPEIPLPCSRSFSSANRYGDGYPRQNEVPEISRQMPFSSQEKAPSPPTLPPLLTYAAVSHSQDGLQWQHPEAQPRQGPQIPNHLIPHYNVANGSRRQLGRHHPWQSLHLAGPSTSESGVPHFCQSQIGVQQTYRSNMHQLPLPKQEVTDLQSPYHQDTSRNEYNDQSDVNLYSQDLPLLSAAHPWETAREFTESIGQFKEMFLQCSELLDKYDDMRSAA